MYLCLSVSLCLSAPLSLCLSVSLSLYLSVSLSLCLSISSSLSLYLGLSDSLPFISLSLCLLFALRESADPSIEGKGIGTIWRR